MSRVTLWVLASAVFAFFVGAVEIRGAAGAPTLDDRVYAIAAELMCPVCGGQTVAESNSALAEQMRTIIRERLHAGQTREDIIAYFVGQFGEGILAAPPPRGGGLPIWLAPAIVIGIGLVALSRYVRRMSRAAPSPLPAPTPAEAEAVKRELRDLD